MVHAPAPGIDIACSASAARGSRIAREPCIGDVAAAAATELRGRAAQPGIAHEVRTPGPAGTPDMIDVRPLDIPVDSGRVSGLLLRPADARALLVLGHGAGAGMRHPFMEALSRALAGQGISTLRYQFPYMEKRERRTDPPAVAAVAIRAACAVAGEEAPDLPLVAGGKSFGGRMTSTAQAEAPLPRVRGLVFFGFPLHPPRRPAITRAEHLTRVEVPMLFLQGTRDELADLALLRPVIDGLATKPMLHVIEGGDHSFSVLKRSGRTAEDVLAELAAVTAAWVDGLGT